MGWDGQSAIWECDWGMLSCSNKSLSRYLQQSMIPPSLSVLLIVWYTAAGTYFFLAHLKVKFKQTVLTLNTNVFEITTGLCAVAMSWRETVYSIQELWKCLQVSRVGNTGASFYYKYFSAPKKYRCKKDNVLF